MNYPSLFLNLLLELGGVDTDTDVFHAGQYAHQRDLDVVVQRAEALGLE